MISITDKKSAQTLILIGGWGFDIRIFDAINLPCNLILTDGHPQPNPKEILSALQKLNTTEDRILAGWSMGFYTANELAKILKVNKLIGISARPSYNHKALNNIAAMIKRNKAAYMKKFYRDCFTPTENEFYKTEFRKNLQNLYLESFDQNFLISGLEQLGKGKLEIEELKQFDLTFIHGQMDNIAPIAEISDFTQQLPQAELISIADAGHLPFIHSEFAEIFCNG